MYVLSGLGDQCVGVRVGREDAMAGTPVSGCHAVSLYIVLSGNGVSGTGTSVGERRKDDACRRGVEGRSARRFFFFCDRVRTVMWGKGESVGSVCRHSNVEKGVVGSDGLSQRVQHA